MKFMYDEGSVVKNSLYTDIIEKLVKDFGVLECNSNADRLGICIVKDYRLIEDCYCRIELKLMLAMILRRGTILLSLIEEDESNSLSRDDIEDLENYIEKLRRALNMLQVN